MFTLLTVYLILISTVDSAQIDKDAKIPEDVMRGLRDLGLFGLLIPEEYGETINCSNLKCNDFNWGPSMETQGQIVRAGGR